MPVLPHKAVFERDPSYYPGGDVLAWASSARLDGVFLHCRIRGHEDRGARAAAAGWPIWWYAGPDHWTPETWRATRLRCLELVGRGWGVGYVCNAERAPLWAGHRSEVQALAAALDSDSRAGLSVGFASIPAWPNWRVIAHGARLVWGAPELYGIVTPGTPAELLARGEPWRREFGGGYRPCLAAWNRSALEQRAYLAGMSGLEGGAFWHERPAPSGGVLDAIASWEPRPPDPSVPPSVQSPPAAALVS